MDDMNSGTEKPVQGGWPLRRPVIVIAFMAAAIGLLFGAYRLGLFGSSIDKSIRAAQNTVSEQQDVVIPGMPVCLPDTTPTTVPAQAAPTSQPLTSVFGLAWFHKPPQDGTSAADIAESHRYIHLTGVADIPFLNQLRDAGYKGP